MGEIYLKKLNALGKPKTVQRNYTLNRNQIAFNWNAVKQMRFTHNILSIIFL